MRPRTARRIAHLLLAIASGVTVFPLVWMVASAFTPNDLVLAQPWRLWPEQPTLENFRIASERHPVWAWLWNSVLTASLITLGKLALSLPAGFAFARLSFRGRDTGFWLVLATLSFPTALAIIPTYIAVVRLGLTDTLAGMIVPMIPYVGFYVFQLRQVFRSLPGAMFDAAAIDGCGPLGQFLRIALPNVLPSIAALSVIAFLGAWNIYLWAALVIDSPENRTLATGIAVFAEIDGSQRLWGPLMATATLSVVPVLVLFLVVQRWVMAAFAPE